MGRAYADSSERWGHDANGYPGQAAGVYQEDAQQQYAGYWQQAAWEEAGRIADAERQRLEMELQAKLDLVAMDLDAIESINKSTVRGLRFKVFLSFVLAIGIASGAGYYYTKKLRPQMGSLQSLVFALNNEQARLEHELRAKADDAKALQQKLDMVAAELEKARPGRLAALLGSDTKPVEAKPVPATPSPSPVVTAATPVVTATAPVTPASATAIPAPTADKAPTPAGDVKPAVMLTPKPDAHPVVTAVHVAAPLPPKVVPAVVVRKPPAHVCKCDPGDPMCGCIP